MNNFLKQQQWDNDSTSMYWCIEYGTSGHSVKGIMVGGRKNVYQKQPGNIWGTIPTGFLKYRTEIWAKYLDSGGFTMEMGTKAKCVNEISQEKVQSER